MKIVRSKKYTKSLQEALRFIALDSRERALDFKHKLDKHINNTINSTKQEDDMITLKIENKEVENIFLEGFDSNKEAFLNFIKDSYNKMTLLNSLDRSVKQAKLQ